MIEQSHSIIIGMTHETFLWYTYFTDRISEYSWDASDLITKIFD